MDRSGNSPMVGLQVAEDIVPIGELKAHLSERIRDLKSRRRPLVVTQNGKAAAVMLAPEVSTLEWCSPSVEGRGNVGRNATAPEIAPRPLLKSAGSRFRDPA